MKTVIMYSCATVGEAQQKSAELQAAGYRLDVFEADVQLATADFRLTGGQETPHFGSFWVVIGTLPA